MELINFAAKYDATIKDLGYVKGIEVFTKGVFIAQGIISGVKAYNAWNNSDGDCRTNDGNKWGVTAKSTLDITVGGIATFGGPIGWIVGGVYFNSPQSLLQGTLRKEMDS